MSQKYRPAWAEEFRAWRKREDLTLREIAQALEVNKTTVSQWNTGRDHPSYISQRMLYAVWPGCPLAAPPLYSSSLDPNAPLLSTYRIVGRIL